MLFSWTIALFTWIASLLVNPVLDQGNSNMCVAYAISQCTNTSTGDIWSEIQWYWALPNLVYRDHWVRYLSNHYNANSLYNSWDIKSSIDNGKPVLWFLNWFEWNIYIAHLPEWPVSLYRYRVKRISTDSINWHAVCIVWYNDEGIVIKNSYWKLFGEDWYWLIKRKDTEKNNYFYSIN